MQLYWILIKEKCLKNPNFWTWQRIWGCPLVIFLLEYDFHLKILGWSPLALILFFYLALTDGIDGWVARRYGRISLRGTVFDPEADKILVLSLLAYFWWSEREVESTFFWLLTAREIAVLFQRRVAEDKGVAMPANRVGKCKACVQYFTVISFMGYGCFFEILGNLFLFVSTFLAYWSWFKLYREKRRRRVTN